MFMVEIHLNFQKELLILYRYILDQPTVSYKRIESCLDTYFTKWLQLTQFHWSPVRLYWYYNIHRDYKNGLH